MKKLLLVALNEFSLELFDFASKAAKLPNLKHLLCQHHSGTWTNDQVERHGLDPWVQWVSIHTGQDSATHNIRHLGDVPNLSTPQLWEKLSDHGLTSGIWGAMNASRNNAKNCKFFLPDPWTFSEKAHPTKLNRLLALPRYYAKNYLDASKRELLKSLLDLTGFILSQPLLLMKLLRISPLAFKGIFQFGLKNHVLFSIFDLISTEIFLHYREREKPDFSLLFLNSIAHMQHNIWCETGTLDARCLYSLRVVDKIIGRINNSAAGDEVWVMNALTQVNVVSTKNEILYRQMNPADFLTSMGISYLRVEQLMTNDGHIFFEHVEDAIIAKEILKQAEIASKAMFDVEYSTQTPCKLFFQLDIWDPLPRDAKFTLGNKQHPFFEHFEAVTKRTGEHIQSGDVFSTSTLLPPQLFNHEIHNEILKFYRIPDSSENKEFSQGFFPATTPT